MPAGACAHAPLQGSAASGDRLFNLSIQIGRLEVIVDQESSALTTQAPQDSPAPAGRPMPGPAADEASLLASLQAAVLYHSSVQAAACRAKVLRQESCESYEPQWLRAPASTVVAVDLQRWADETQDAIVPVWTELCTKAVAKTGNADFCAIE